MAFSIHAIRIKCGDFLIDMALKINCNHALPNRQDRSVCVRILRTNSIQISQNNQFSVLLLSCQCCPQPDFSFLLFFVHILSYIPSRALFLSDLCASVTEAQNQMADISQLICWCFWSKFDIDAIVRWNLILHCGRRAHTSHLKYKVTNNGSIDKFQKWLWCGPLRSFCWMNIRFCFWFFFCCFVYNWNARISFRVDTIYFGFESSDAGQIQIYLYTIHLIRIL